jgi:hypothetical protein
MSYCMPYSKLIWSRGTILIEDGLAALDLLIGVLSIVFDPS